MATHTIVVGGQYGSEGKGAFCRWLVDNTEPGYTACIRAGGPQAGHTVLDGDTPLAFTTLPVSTITTRPMDHIIGPATVVDPDRLAAELEWVPHARVLLDYRATVLEPSDKTTESTEMLVERLGSTGKGVGAARAARVMRTARTAGDTTWPDRVHVIDTIPTIRQHWRDGRVLCEGAQGLGLSLFTGGHYPYATSGECTAIQMLSDIGMDLRTLRDSTWETVGVYRSFPIRTGGNSGPLKGETTWEELRQTFGAHIPIELTTVTKRVRRVGAWDPNLARRTAQIGGVDRAALTFVDYPYPEAARLPWDAAKNTIRQYVYDRSGEIGVPVGWVSVGFGEIHPWS